MKRLRTLLLFLFIPLLSSAPEFDAKYDIGFTSYFEYYQNRKTEMKNLEFSYNLLIEYLKLRNIPNLNIVLSQAILETGHFTSDIFLYNNNLFGMKQARIRPTTAIGTERNHALYEHWIDSADDYILWYRYTTRNKQYTNYYVFLIDIGYAEDRSYPAKLKFIYNNFLKNGYKICES